MCWWKAEEPDYTCRCGATSNLYSVQKITGGGCADLACGDCVTRWKLDDSYIVDKITIQSKQVEEAT